MSIEEQAELYLLEIFKMSFKARMELHARVEYEIRSLSQSRRFWFEKRRLTK